MTQKVPLDVVVSEIILANSDYRLLANKDKLRVCGVPHTSNSNLPRLLSPVSTFAKVIFACFFYHLLSSDLLQSCFRYALDFLGLLYF